MKVGGLGLENEARRMKVVVKGCMIKIRGLSLIKLR